MKKMLLLLCTFTLSFIHANNDLPKEVMAALMIKRQQQIREQNDAIAKVHGSVINCLSAGYALLDHRMLKKIFDALDENDAWDLANIEDDYQSVYAKYISTREQLINLQEKYRTLSDQEIEGMEDPLKGMQIIYMDKQRPQIAHLG